MGPTTITSGRSLLDAIATGGLPRPPAVDLLDLELDEVGDGWTRFSFVADERYAKCVGRVVHLGRSQANATAEIRSPDGHLHVTALATCRVRT